MQMLDFQNAINRIAPNTALRSLRHSAIAGSIHTGAPSHQEH